MYEITTMELTNSMLEKASGHRFEYPNLIVLENLHRSVSGWFLHFLPSYVKNAVPRCTNENIEDQ